MSASRWRSTAIDCRGKVNANQNHGRMAQDMKRELIAIIGEMKDPA
ncbi:hypothetical protein NIA69_00755 [Gemmiger formicilis]|nr:hypothetical protein [Gemmiger formicilis]